MESYREMRIIGGKFKGRKIQFIKSNLTRPLKDSVKENIFNILHHSQDVKTKVLNSNILDVYSGIGSFGLECLSRGAKNVTFVEKDYNALKILNNNIKTLVVTKKVRIFDEKIEVFFELNKLKFDIFFFDPPFSDKEFVRYLKIIKEKKLYKSKHVVVIHREKSMQDEFSDDFKVFLIKIYGRSKIIFGNFI